MHHVTSLYILAQSNRERMSVFLIKLTSRDSHAWVWKVLYFRFLASAYKSNNPANSSPSIVFFMASVQSIWRGNVFRQLYVERSALCPMRMTDWKAGPGWGYIAHRRMQYLLPWLNGATRTLNLRVLYEYFIGTSDPRIRMPCKGMTLFCF